MDVGGVEWFFFIWWFFNFIFIFMLVFIGGDFGCFNKIVFLICYRSFEFWVRYVLFRIVVVVLFLRSCSLNFVFSESLREFGFLSFL